MKSRFSGFIKNFPFCTTQRLEHKLLVSGVTTKVFLNHNAPKQHNKIVTQFHCSVLKTAKAVPIFKKDSKLHYRNYGPILLLSNIEKILENLCIRDYTPFSITTILSITYSLDLDNNILYLMP